MFQFGYNTISMEKQKALIDIQKDIEVRVISCPTGRILSGRLRQLGLVPGICVRVIRHAPLGGPYLIQIGDREVALGRGIAAQIIVVEETCA